MKSLKKVWIASGDRETLSSLYKSLKKKGLKPSKFSDGVDIIKRLVNGAPDLIIIDFILDSLDGAKLSRLLKSDRRYKEIPIIFLLAEEAMQIFNPPADITLTKISSENLHLKILAALSSIEGGKEFPSALWDEADKGSIKGDAAPKEMFILKNKLDAVFEENVSGIMELNNVLTIISINIAMERILGRPALDIIGNSFYREFPEWKKKIVLSPGKSLKIKNPVLLDYNNIILEASVSMTGAADAPLGYYIMFNDVTERQKYQEKLTEYTERLEEEVEQRVHEIKMTNRELERLNRMKSEFLSNVSHEMRTPLATIKGFTETLLNREVSADIQREFLGIISSESNRMERIVGDILDITSIKQGITKKRLNFTKFDLVDELKTVLKILKPLSDKKSITMKQKHNPAEISIKGDRDRIRQVFINIIENAIKFSPERSIIKIGLSENGKQAVFSCADQGAGIPRDKKDRIFEKFYMIDGSDRRAHRGTGVGLYIASEIVKLHNGEIMVDTHKRIGSRFIVKLPLNPNNPGK